MRKLLFILCTFFVVALQAQPYRISQYNSSDSIYNIVQQNNDSIIEALPCKSLSGLVGIPASWTITNLIDNLNNDFDLLEAETGVGMDTLLWTMNGSQIRGAINNNYTSIENYADTVSSCFSVINAPFQDSILFTLSSISDTNFVDAINGWHFPISNKDWTDDSTMYSEYLIDVDHFPYKSLATVQAPAKGTAASDTIINYDVNNFWYAAADSTPQQIPVTWLFENIDYEDKLFCREVARQTNAHGEERSPKGKGDITLYKLAMTSELDSLSTFFGDIINKPTNVVYVDRDSGDNANDGSWGNPKLTIDSAYIASIDNDTIVILSAFTEDLTPTSGQDHLRLDGKKVVFMGAGRAVVRGVGSYFYHNVHYDNDSIRWINCQLEGGGLDVWDTRGWHVINCSVDSLGSDLSSPFIIRSCRVTGGRPFVVYNNYDGITIDNYYHNTTQSYGNNTDSIVYCKFNVSAGYNGIGIAASPANDITIKYNYFEYGGVNTSCISMATITDMDATPPNLIIERNKFVSKANTYPEYGIKIAVNDVGYSGDSLYDATIRYNVFADSTEENPGASTTKYVSIGGEFIGNIDLSYNYFYQVTAYRRTCIGIAPADSLYNYAKWNINYNRFFINTLGQAIYMSEGIDGHMEAVEVDIIGNYINGCLDIWPDSIIETHGVLANRGKDYEIKYNRFDYLPLGLVVKTDEGTLNDSLRVQYNVFYNNHAAYYNRRASTFNYVNNTFVTDSSHSFLRFGESDHHASSGDLPDMRFSNNIFSVKGIRSNKLCHSFAREALYFADSANLNYDIWDISDISNVIYDDDGSPIGGYPFKTAQDSGWITNADSTATGLLYMDLYGGDVSLQTGSTGLGDGISMGLDYNYGLDPSTDWNSDSTDWDVDNYPEIVLRQQTGVWDRGAYVRAGDYRPTYLIDKRGIIIYEKRRDPISVKL